MAKSFSDFTYGVGLEVTASSFKQVKDDLKLNFDSLAKMVKSYSKILKINPDADLSDLFDQMKKLQSIMDGIQNSDNPFDGFVDKGVLTRVAELESGIAAIGAISNEAKAGVSELKTSIATMTNTLKMAGAEKFPGTFKNLFGDSAAEIQKTTKQLEQLQNIQKKLGRTRYDLDDTTGKDLSLNIGVSEDDLNEYDLFVQRFFKLEQKIAQASPDQLQDLAIELQDVATKIVTVFNKMSQSQFNEVPYDDFLNAIDVVINKVQQRRDQLQQELSKLNDMQQQHLSSKLSAKQSSSRSVGVVGTGEIQVTPKTNDAEWVKIINTTIANIEPQLVPVKITPTFAHNSKSIQKEIGADESKITHTVNAKIDIVDNLDDFNERIKYIDKLITNAKKQLEKNTKFNVSFQYEDGGRFKDVVQSVVKDLKNINATVKLTNPKTFKSAINDLKDGAKKQLKDIPATFVIGNQDKILASVDDMRAKIEQKVNNIGVNLNLQNMPEFLAQAAMMRNVVEQVYHDNPVGAISGPVAQDVVANNSVHSVEELSENAQKAKKTLEDCKVALNSLLANKFDAPEFLQFGDIDTNGKKKKDSAKHLESLLKEYKALQAKELNKNRTPEEWSALYPDANGNLEIVRQALKQDLTRLKQLETDLNLYYQKQLAYIQSRQEESEKILETERQIAKTQNKQDGQKAVPSDTSKTTGTNKTTVRSLTGKISYSKKVLDDLNKGWEKSSFFKTLGEWDQDSGKFNKDSKHILELIKKYNQLKDARLAANKETGKNTRAGAEEKKLKQTLDAIHKSQIQHQNEILAKQKQELEQAKKIANTQKPKETKKKQTGVSKQSVAKLNKAMQQQEELQKKLERTRTIWSDLNKTDFDNNKISSYFTQLGEWDDKTGEFSHNAKSVQDLIEKYQELKRIRAEAGSNEPLKEEIDLRARLDAILEAQKKHVADYGKNYKAELEKVQKNISAETSTGAVDKQMTNTDSYLKNLTDRLNKAKAAFELLDKKKKNFNNLLKTGIGDSVTHVLGKDSTPEDLQKTVRAYNKLAKEQASLRKSGQTQTTEYKTNAKLLSQLKSQLDAVYTAQLEYSKTRMSQLTAEIAKEEEKKQKLVEQRKLIEQQQKEQTKANNAEKASPKQKDKPTQARGNAPVADITSPVVQLDAATLNSLAKDATLRSIDGKIGNIFQSLGKGLKVTGANVSINADNVNVDGNNSSGVKDKKKQTDNSKFAHQLAQEMSNGMKDRVERANALSKAGIKVSRGTLLRNGTDAFDEILKGISPRDVVQAVIWPKLVQQLKAKGLTDTDQFNDILAQIATNSPWKSKTSSSWIHFATPGAKFSGNVTKKAYGAFSNVGDITSELINQILNELTAKGFKGQIKIPSDITGFYDTDQIVGHAANDKSFMILVDTLRKFEKQGVLSNIQTGVDSNTKTTLGYKGKQGASFTTMLEEIYKAAPGEAFSVEEIKSIIKTAVASVSGEVDQALFKPIVDNVIKQRGPAVKPVDAPKITSEAEADYTNKRIQKIRDLIAQLNSIDLNRDYRGKFKALLDGPIEASDISGTASLKELISMYDKDVVDFGILKLGDREIPELAQVAHEQITETLKNLLQKQLERLTAELNRLEGTDAVQDVIPPKENQEKIQPTVEQQNMNQQVAASAEKATQEQSELNEELAETQKLAKSVVTENNLTGETSKIVETYRSDDKVNERKEYYGWVPHEDDDPTFEHTATVMTKNMDAYKKLYNDYIKSLAKQMEIQKKIDASDGSTEKLQEELKIQKEITDNLDLQLSKHTELFTTESKQAAINEASKRAQQAFDKASAGQDDSVVNKRIKKLNQMVEDTQNAYNKMRLIQQQFSQGDIGGVEMPLSDSATAQIEKYGQLLDQLQDKQKEISLDPGLLKDDNYLKGINDLIDGLNKAEENFVDLNQEATEFLSRIRSTSDVHILDDAFNPNDIEQMHDAMRNFADGVGIGQAKLLGFNDINRTATFQIKNNAGELQELTVEYNEATNALGRYISKTKESSSGFTKFFDSIKHSFGNVARYLASFGSVYEVFSWIRQGFTYVREIDAALTELKKVTNETESTYDAFLQTMSKTAGVVGSTVADLTTMASEWARLGYSLEEAGILAENTAILLNVSEFDDATEASEALISTMQAFQYTAEDSQHVVDILNEVGNNYAVSSDGIATALQDSASALMEGGNSLEQAVALVAAANKVVQDPNSVGSALRTISLRLRGTSVKILEQMGEETEGVVESTSKLQEKLKALTGVDILTNAGAYKDTYTILKEIGTVWQNLDPMDQAAALELMAGKNRANTLAAILNNMKDLENAYQSALNAEGSALQENAAYLDSIQGRIDQLTNAVQTMWMNFLNDEAVKGIVSILTEVVKLIDKVGLLNVAVSALFGILTFKKDINIFSSTFNFVKDLIPNIKNLGSGLESVVKNISTWITGMITAKRTAVATTTATNAVATAQTVQAGTSQAAAAGFNAVNVAATGASVGMRLFTAAATMGLSLLIGAALPKIIQWFDDLNETTEETAEKAKEIANTYNSAQKAIDDDLQTLTTSSDTSKYETLLDEFEYLSAGVNKMGENVSLTSDEYSRYASICETIISMNPVLAGTYDEATTAIGKDIDALRELIELKKEEQRLNAAEKVGYGLYAGNGNRETLAKAARDSYKTASKKKWQYESEKGDSGFYKQLEKMFEKDASMLNTAGVLAHAEGVYGSSQDEIATKILEIIGKPTDIIQDYYNYDDNGTIVSFAVDKFYADMLDDIVANEEKVLAYFNDPMGLVGDNDALQGKHARNIMKLMGIPESDYNFFDGIDDIEKRIYEFTDGTAFDWEAFISDDRYSTAVQDYFSNMKQSFINEYSELNTAYRDASKDFKKEQDGLHELLFGVVTAMPEGLDLDTSMQTLLTEWIKTNDAFKFTDEVAQLEDDKLAEWVDLQVSAVESAVRELSNLQGQQIDGELTIQDVIDKMLKIDQSKIDFGTYKNEIQKHLNLILGALSDDAKKILDINGIEDLAVKFDLEWVMDGTDDAPSQTDQFVSELMTMVNEDEETIRKYLENLPTIEVKRMMAYDYSAVTHDDPDTPDQFEGTSTLEELHDVANGDIQLSKLAADAYSTLEERVSSYKDTLSQVSGITSDNTTITQELKDEIDALKLSKEQMTEIFGEENGLIVKNAKALNDYSKAAAKAIVSDTKLAKSHAQLQYYDIVKQLDATIGDVVAFDPDDEQATNAILEQTDALLEQASAIKQSINQYQLLEDTLLGTTSAFEKFAKAQEIDAQNTYGESYVQMAQTMYDAIYKTGQVGSEQFWAAVQANVPEDIYAHLTPGKEQIQAIANYLNNNVFGTLTLDADAFSIDYSDIEDFVEKAQDVGVFSGTDATSFGLSAGFIASLEEDANALEVFAERMGMTTTQVYAMLSEMDKYNADGIGLSMLLHLDQSTTGQITLAANELERLYTQRKALLKQGADTDTLNANMQSIYGAEAKLAGAQKQATDIVMAYAKADRSISNAIKDPEKMLGEVLSAEMIDEIGLDVNADTTKVKDVLEQLKDYLLTFEEPTVVDLEIAQDNIEEELQQLKDQFGEEELEANVRIGKDGLKEIKDSDLTIDKATIERYVTLDNTNQFIDNTLAEGFTTEEALLSEIAENTAIMAGKEELPKESDSANGGGDSDSPSPTTGEKPESDAESAKLTLGTGKALNDLMQAIIERSVDIKGVAGDSLNIMDSNMIDGLGDIYRQALDLQKQVNEGIIFPEDAQAQLSQLKTQAEQLGVEIPVSFMPDEGTVLDIAKAATDNVSSEVQEAADATLSEMDRIYQAYGSQAEKIAALKTITEAGGLDYELNAADALALGLQTVEGQTLTVADAWAHLKAEIEATAGSLSNPENFAIHGVKSYAALQGQADSLNAVLDQTDEVLYDNIEITQSYKDALIGLCENKEELDALNECFDTNNTLVVKNAKQIKKLLKEKKDELKTDTKLAKGQAQLEYYDLVKQLSNTLNGVEDLNAATIDSVASLFDQIDAVRQTIHQYQMLEDTLLGVANAFKQFRQGKQQDEQNTYGNEYVDMAQTMYDAFYKTGQVGTEANWAAITALVPEHVYAGVMSDAQRMKEIYDYFNNNILPSLTIDGDQLSLQFKNVEDFVKKGLTKNAEGESVFTGDTKNFDLVEGMNLEKAAQLMGMTEAQAYAMFAELDKYNTGRASGEQSFLQQLDDSTAGDIMATTTEIENLNKQKMALLKNSGYEENAEQIKKINEKLADNEKHLSDLGEQSYNTWQEYTQNEAVLQGLGAIENKQQLLTEEMAKELGINWDENSGKTVQQVYDELLAKQLLLEQPTVLTAQFAVDHIYKEIADLESALDKLKKGDGLTADEKLALGLTVDASNEELQQEISAKIKKLEEDKEFLAINFGVKLSEEDQASVNAKLSEIQEFTIGDKKFKVIMSGASETILKIMLVKKWWDTLQSKTLKLKLDDQTGGDGTNSSGGSSGSGGVNGTAHVHGTAFKSGSWGAPRTETALVGELGPELLVRGNRWTTIGENGAEFRHIRKGDIIFNHKQTEDLLSKGYVTGRGKALAGGTAFASGTAYAGLWTPTDGKEIGDAAGKLSDAARNMSKSSDDLSKDFKEIFDWIEVRIEEITESLDLKSAKLDNAVGSKDQNALITEMIETNKTLYTNLTAGAAKYYEYAAKLLENVPVAYREAVQDGSIAIESFRGKVGEKTYEAIQDYREWVQKGADATQQAEETLTEISDLAKQAIDNIASDYENKISIPESRIEQLEAYNSLLETDLGAESADIYKVMAEENKRIIGLLEQQRNEMQAKLNAEVEAGHIEKYSQNWYDAVNDIAAVDTEIIELTTDIEDYQDSINDLHWDHFDNIMSRLEAVADESENLIDILGSKDLVDQDTAEWTDEGITTLGLYAQQMEAAEVQAQKYKEEIDYLNDHWQSLGYTEQEYVEKLEELKDGQYDAIKSYNDTKEAIKDLTSERVEAIKKGIEKEIEAYEELIEKKQEELDAEKDLYDFQRGVADQQKEIADIERKLAALSSDNSASARAQRAKLQAELAEAQQELQDTYYDRSISDQQEALDRELENFREEKDKEMEGWDEYLENTEQVVSDSLATVQTNTEIVYHTLQVMGEEYSLSIADAITSPWEDGAYAIQDYSEKFKLSMSSTVEELQKLAEEYKKVMAEIDDAGDKAVDKVASNTGTYEKATYKEPVKATNPEQVKQESKTQNIAVGDTVYAGDAQIYSDSNGSKPKKQYYSKDPVYYVADTGNVSVNSFDRANVRQKYVAVRHHSQDSGITGWFKRTDLEKYAKGTTGVKNNQLAWIDELGEELVLRPQNGRLSFMEKGTSVIPSDLTENLMEWGELDPSVMLERNRPEIKLHPEVHNTEVNITMDIAEVVHVDKVDHENMPDLTKAVEKQLDKYMKNLNNQIRRYVR